MKLWNTNLFLNHTTVSLKSDKININCGIFYGDSLSPLLFCLSLMPLTTELNNTRYGYKIYEKTIDHLFYRDDLELYAKNDKELEGLLSTVKQFSDDIVMGSGLDNCAKETTIRELDQDKIYKYPGINEGNGIQHVR